MFYDRWTKGSGRDFPCTTAFYRFLFLCCFNAKLFLVRSSCNQGAAYFDTLQTIPLHRGILPTSAPYKTAMRPTAKDPRSIYRLFCDPLKRSSPFKSAVNLRLPRCNRTRTFSGLVCTKSAISLSEYS